MLKVRTLPSRSSSKQLLVFAFALAWAAASVAILTAVEDRLLAVGLVAIGLPIFMLLLRLDGKERNQPVQCLDCKQGISPALEGSDTSGEPVLYHCKRCDIVWYNGMHRRTS